MAPFRHAFTLIELLVVVTIIVILLALLTPALDKAIYQAELAVCAANQHATATGVQGYALGAKKFYPYRKVIQVAGFPIEAVSCQNSFTGDMYDDRPTLRTFLSLNAALNCPLTGELDLEGSKPSSVAFSAYVLWFGVQYTGDPGMLRMGQRLKWSSATAAREIDLLVSDQNIFQRDGAGLAVSNHPDNAGVMTNQVAQDQNVDGIPPVGAGGLPATRSRWISFNTKERGEVDLNFARTDGSVGRFTEVLVDDPRFNGSPGPDYFANKGAAGWEHRLPLR